MGISTATAQEHKLVSSFETVSRTLAAERYRDRWSKPLAYWALPGDRRLPLAFLGRSIRDLIQTPFDELAETPGIGEKKLTALVKLLARATSDEPPSTPFGLTELTDERARTWSPLTGETFDACVVSEVLWSEWTRTVRQFDLGDETLGRVAASLREMPTVIWDKKLGDYMNLTLAEIRGLRTYGEKRVRCVLAAFHAVHEAVRRTTDKSQLARRLGARTVAAVDHWIREKIATGTGAATDEVRRRFAEPILQQLEIDCGRTVHRLARERLGIDGDGVVTVREQAETMGVTRARVYQLLDDCHRVIAVRWPDGKLQLDRLASAWAAGMDDGRGADDDLFQAARQLCFPDRSHVADAVA